MFMYAIGNIPHKSKQVIYQTNLKEAREISRYLFDV